MLHLARMARLAVDACTADNVGSPQKLADLKVQAWGHFGNSLRVCGRLEEAEQAFAIAQNQLPEGTGDPLIRAFLFEQLGSLHTSRRRFEQAVELLEEAERLYQELGIRWLRARSRILKAIAILYSGEPGEALRLLEQAIPLIDPDEDPYLLLAARHNLLRCLIDLDRPDEALALYHQVRELNQQFTDPLIQLRNTWQEGKLLRELGHLRPAEEKLLQARRGFMERGLAYEVAVVSLDLADVYAKLGRVGQVNQLVAETLPIFRALRVGRDMLAALIQLRQVARQEQRTADQAPS
jgi:tetratricopeptide (TPR) repeat protein